jgi:cell wall-associated NlpC family hydrolase
LTLILAGCALRPVSTPPQNTAPEGAAITPQVTAPRPLDHAAIMVGSATAMLGQPYRYGGAAPGGFDCSGLVEYAAKSAGIHVPRTAREQLHSGTLVERADLKAGDLVFMRLARKELHVGIVIDGERFIHAPASGGRVRIDSLAARPYATGFISARRVAGVPGASSDP